MPTVKQVNKWQQDSLKSFRERFNAKSNAEALDKLDSLINYIHSMYSDNVKYPQLGLHPMQQERLMSMMKIVPNQVKLPHNWY